MALLKIAEHTPEPLMRAVGSVISPPKNHPQPRFVNNAGEAADGARCLTSRG